MKNSEVRKHESVNEYDTVWERVETPTLHPDGTTFKCFGCAGEVPILKEYWSWEAHVYDPVYDTEHILHFCQRCAIIMDKWRQRGKNIDAGYGSLRFSKLSKADRDWWTEIVNERKKLKLVSASSENVRFVRKHHEEDAFDVEDGQEEQLSPEAGEFNLYEKELSIVEKEKKSIASFVRKLKKKNDEIAPAQMKIQVAVKQGKDATEACHALVLIKNEMDDIIKSAKKVLG